VERNHLRLPVLDPNRDLPILLLGVEAPDPDVKLEFASDRHWYYVQHQTGGYCCYQRPLYATPLALRDQFRQSATSLADSWLGSQAGCQRVDLDEVLRYRSQLRDLFDLDCRHSFRRFEEAYYPIDATAESVRRLAVDDVPDDLDDWLLAAIHRGRTILSPGAGAYCRDGWQLVLLGPNSD
jgi:hypothetical protein